MIKKIIYSILITIVVVSITIGTLAFQIKKRNIQVYENFLNEASSGNYDNFFKIQTKYYKKVDSITNENYEIDVHLLITGVNDFKTIMIIVKPLKEINYASKIDDRNDQTKALIYNNGLLVYDSKDINNYSDVAISYGLNKISFYYYQFTLNDLNNFDVNLFDYDNNEIINEFIEITQFSDFSSFNKGFTNEEYYELIKSDKTYLNTVYIVFAISFTIGMGVIIFLFRKKMM